MNILFAASEMIPFCKTGGLADVAGSLPPVLAEMGHQVTVMLPGYTTIDRKKFKFKEIGNNIGIPVGNDLKPLTVSKTVFRGVAIYLLENTEYFNRQGLYGDVSGDYPDNGERFIFFSRGVLETIRTLGLKPDIIHAHDWQSGLVTAYLATLYKDDPVFKKTGTLFTIHNLGYQGLFDEKIFAKTGIPREEFTWKKLEFYDKVSFIKGGIVYADAVSTVSETYAKEITREPLGFGLHGALAERGSNLFGIVNGIDTDDWNPATDISIPAQYNSNKMEGKTICRRELLRTCTMKAGETIPVFGMVTRLDDQKGLDIFEKAIGRLIALDIRMVILGTGTAQHHAAMNELSERYHGSLTVFLKFDNNLAKQIYAGSDAFLMPSRYEPCGLGQLIAMRYGTLPVVHATGGLADTVHDVGENPKEGNGFVFDEYTADALVDAVGRAVKTLRSSGRKHWNTAIHNAMTADYSWKKSAEKYCDLYSKIGNRKKN